MQYFLSIAMIPSRRAAWWRSTAVPIWQMKTATPFGVWAMGASPKPHSCGELKQLRASGNRYTKNWSIFVWKDLLWAWAPGGIAAGTAVRGALAAEPSASQKCLQSCNAFPQGLESVAKGIAEEITSQQKCADCRKEATERTEVGEAAFPLLFCCRSSYGEQNKW